MSDLFTDDLSTLKLADLKHFLCLDRPKGQKPREGPTLDFKEDVPSDLGNDVAALANTYGGLILLGVKKDPENKNLPADLVGAELGTDPVARLTDKISASVHPRPELDIQPIKLEAAARWAAIIRVREGTFPPYEYSQGATVRVPIRIQDTTRQASVRELERLFAKRDALGAPASELISPLLQAGYISPMIKGEKPSADQADPFFNKILVVPRSRGRLRLDSRFERKFEQLVRDVFQPDAVFKLAREPGVQHEELIRRAGEFHQYEFRLWGKRNCHRLWRIYVGGELLFATNHSRIRVPHPVGDLAGDFLLFCRLATALSKDRDYFGSSVLASELSPPPSREFGSAFPSDLDDYDSDYDEAGGIAFPKEDLRYGQPGNATVVEEVDYHTLVNPVELVGNVLLQQLRHLSAARVDFQRLIGQIDRLNDCIKRNWLARKGSAQSVGF